jgi:two-component system heavy metal sensor histidine kinase CusS
MGGPVRTAQLAPPEVQPSSALPLALRSISVRLAMWYGVATTLTLGAMSSAGYTLLHNRLVNGLDMLNLAQYQQIKAKLLPDFDNLTPQMIDARVRGNAESAPALFYVEIHSAKTGTVFHSKNLRGLVIPDVKGQRLFNSYVETIGELRVSEFILGPYDVTIGTPMGPVEEVMDGYRKICLGLLGAALLMSVGIGLVLSRYALRPVRLISRTANSIRSDNLAERIAVSDVRDEVSELALMLNQMFDRLEASFSQVRRFTADASHELKTPLSVIRLYAERLLLRGGLDAQQEESLHVQLEELARLDQIVEELIFLSRADSRALTLACRDLDPGQFLDGFTVDARVLAEHHGKQFTSSHEGTELVSIDDKRIRQVLLNLLTNALNVSPPGSIVSLVSRVERGSWQLALEDEGTGLPPDQYERIFERFVRIPGNGEHYKGSGLGLAICRSIVELHQGRIYAQAASGRSGLCIRVELPAAASAAPV